jgi:hypothetical protein
VVSFGIVFFVVSVSIVTTRIFKSFSKNIAIGCSLSPSNCNNTDGL